MNCRVLVSCVCVVNVVYQQSRGRTPCVCVRAATVMDVPAGGLLEDRIDRAWFFAGGPPLPPPRGGSADPPPPPAVRQQLTQQRQQQQPANARSGIVQQRQQLDAASQVAADDGSDSLETSSVVAESIGNRVRCARQCVILMGIGIHLGID